MNCVGFSRWLDEGMPAGAADEAKAHAAVCDACSRALEAERAVGSLLGGKAAAAPRSFVEDVMRRVAAEPIRPALAGVLPQDPELSWWIRFLAEPATALAFVVAALLIAWGSRLWSSLPTTVSNLSSLMRVESFTRAFLEWSTLHPATASALAVPLLLGTAALSVGLYKGVMRLASI